MTTCIPSMAGRIPERYRIALTLADLQQLPLKQVGLELGLSLPGAKSRLRRARRMMLERFLECCRIEFDGRGKPLACVPRTAGDGF